MKTRPLWVIALVAIAAGIARGQTGPPVPAITPLVEHSAIHPGGTERLAVRVALPAGVHVNSDKPRDPSLIPTVLTLTTPDGVKVDEISYPAPSELAQKDRKETLAVLGPEFSIEIKATLAAGVAAGELKIPAVLRYQACNDSVCFAPTRANAEWTVRVQ